MISLRIPLRSIIYWKCDIDRFCFLIFYLYICSGNLSRFISFGAFKDNLLITEFLLYVFCFLRLITDNRFNFRYVKFLGIALVLFASSFYGAILNKFDFGSTLYSVRLILMILAGIQMGELFFKKFGCAIENFYRYISSLYFVLTILGFGIYFVFRHSTEFWQVLAGIGIIFGGDPHIGRYVSVYFDPNYFAAIGSIPFITMYRLNCLGPSIRTVIKLSILSLSVWLSWSRSGIATFFFMAVYFFVEWFMQNRMRILKNKWLFNICGGLVFFAVALAIRFDDAFRFFSKLIHTRTDGTAFARWDSFKLGLAILSDYPLFGVGYNYLRLFVKGILGGSSVDSSVLATVVNFGLIPSSLFVVMFVVWSVNFISSYNSIKEKDKEVFLSSRAFFAYLLFVIIFTCHFNNVLYYQFWLVPVVAIFTYYSLCIKQIKKLGY